MKKKYNTHNGIKTVEETNSIESSKKKTNKIDEHLGRPVKEKKERKPIIPLSIIRRHHGDPSNFKKLIRECPYSNEV